MSNPWIDVKYANLLSGKLQQFKIKKSMPYLANCRCPICGDSQKNKLKARGYLFQHKNEMAYKCHNCGFAAPFGKFLKQLDTYLYDEYTREHYLNKPMHSNSINVTVQQNVKPDITNASPPRFLAAGSPLRQLKKISQLTWDHPAKQYIINRKIDNPWHAKLFYAPKFAAWTNSIIPDKLIATRDEPRLIIPFLKEDKTLFGYQGRSFDPNSKLRYITIMIEDYPKIFGLDTVNKDTRCYVFEGPIDSMFIPNSIAMAGADIRLDSSFKDPVFIFDNEPRNKEIVKRIDKHIDMHYNIVIWDDSFNGKDVNEMILNGADAEHIKIVIDKRTFKGLEAKVELNKWKRCNEYY